MEKTEQQKMEETQQQFRANVYVETNTVLFKDCWNHEHMTKNYKAFKYDLIQKIISDFKKLL